MTPAEAIKANQAALIQAEIDREEAEIQAKKLQFEKYLISEKRKWNKKYILSLINETLAKDPLRTYYITDSLAYSSFSSSFTSYDPLTNHIIKVCEKMGFKARKSIGGHTAGGGSDPYYTSDSYELEVKITW